MDNDFEIELKCGKKNIRFLVDTGADVSVITMKTAERLGGKIVETKRLFTGADGSMLQVVGKMRIDLISAWGQKVSSTVYVMKGARNNLLGKPEVRKFNIVKTVRVVKEEIQSKHPKLFGELGVLPDVFKINLKEDAVPLCLCVPRRVPIGLREATKRELERMEKLGVIEKVEHPTSWCSGMVVAPKSNGKVRLCVDLTQLNKSVRREHFPLPRLEDTIASLEGSKYFSKMDANSGFWQIRLDKDSREYTTFITPFGRYQYCKMPFGISAAPEFFQRQMCKILGDSKGVVCMMDDILVVGNTKEEHDRRLEEVLNKLECSGMTLNKDKCEFGVKEVKFLGHILSGDGIKVDPEKERAIKDMAAPKDLAALKRFLAMVNYLGRFSPLLSEIEVPLRELERNKNDWCWTYRQQESFDRVKEVIIRSPVLALFDYERRHRVTADASAHSLGAALMQENDMGEWQPVVYASRRMTDTERRYGQIEKEALAITWACEKFDFYLVGRMFEIETDHKPLIPLLGSRDLSDLPLRVQRFKMRLMRYQYDIFHTPGKGMFVADLLSRPPDAKEMVKIQRVERHAQIYVNAISDVNLEAVKEAAEKDTEYQDIVRGIGGDWPERISAEGRKVRANIDNLSIVDGLVMLNTRIYIPLELRAEVLRKLHSGHQGIVKTTRRARESVWWPSINKEIQDMIEGCNTCIKHQRMQYKTMKTGTLPDTAWEMIGTDLFEFEGQWYALFIDYFSRWIEVADMRSQTGEHLVRKFRPLLARYGAPKVIRSDNGPCYISQEWKGLMEEYAIDHQTSSPHYHQSNGMAERGVETIKMMWRKEKDKTKALLAYRTTPLESLYRPDELMMGRKLRNEIPAVGAGLEKESNFKERDRRLKLRQKQDYDRSHRARVMDDLADGDTVWVKVSHKDASRPGVVRYKAEEPDSYWVEVQGRLLRRSRAHIRRRTRETERTESGAEDNSENQASKVSKPKVSENMHESGSVIGVRESGRVRRKKVDPEYVYY